MPISVCVTDHVSLPSSQSHTEYCYQLDNDEYNNVQVLKLPEEEQW